MIKNIRNRAIEIGALIQSINHALVLAELFPTFIPNQIAKIDAAIDSLLVLRKDLEELLGK